MIEKGTYVRCPVDNENPLEPRLYAIGKVVSVNEFNETAHIKFEDPFGYRDFYDYIPTNLKEAPIKRLDHCHFFKNSLVKYKTDICRVLEYKKTEGLYKYYLQNINDKKIITVDETKIIAPFYSGSANPVHQLKNFEFQNPCWYMGRQVVKNTMSILDNAMIGFKELAGCKIYLKAFQLNTIMQCLQDNTCRYMLADEVGLGKTIEASSILKVFLKDKSNQKVLIAVPEALVAQWRTELLFKFGIQEGININNNDVTLMSVENIDIRICGNHWDFVIVDEVHNYLDNIKYNQIHTISRNASNIIILSATPIQQRKKEYLDLLRLILPEKYDCIDLDEFSGLVEKQNKISRATHDLLDEIDSLRNEVLPEIEGNPHEDEDVLDEIEEIEDILNDLKNLINDKKLNELIDALDFSKDDFELYNTQVIISYICDNYQLERNIIRGRREMLGVYPKDPDGEFAERKLYQLQYKFDDETQFYESEAYRTLVGWITSTQDEMDDNYVSTIVNPLLEAFFSSPWAYVSRLNTLQILLYNIPDDVIKAANRWKEYEDEIIANISDSLDDVDKYPSRLLRVIDYIDQELFGEKVVVFTDQLETFNVYYKVMKEAFGEEVTGFSKSLDSVESEINIYRFQSDPSCKILVCDKSGGEGRNLQMADYVVHIDLPWNINTIEQRIGRLDRMGRDVEVPITSVVIYASGTYEEQLFKFWNEGLNVFEKSLSGLEIIMNEINNKIYESIKTDFEYGLYRLIPELIKEADLMRETVKKEQIFDTVALRYKPLYIQLEKLLTEYQFNENEIFADTMMSWASLAGFGALNQGKDKEIVSFDESHFSLKSAQKAFLLPPDWDSYLSKKQNEIAIKIQRGLELKNNRNIQSDRTIKGTFNREKAINNDYIHFYAPGDELFDCIVDNAMNSYKGMCAAFAAESNINWKGFVYTYSIEPDERVLYDKGVSVYALGMFRQYLSTSNHNVIVPFLSYKDVPEKMVLNEHKRICRKGYFYNPDSIDHLGRRGRDGGFLNIYNKYHASNIDWFRANYDCENWERVIDNSHKRARKIAQTKFNKERDLDGAKEMIDQILSTKESYLKYYGTSNDKSLDELRNELEIIYQSLEKPRIRLESVCFMWLVK